MAYEHGTVSRYTTKRCRCDLCRKANRDYMRAWHAKNHKAAPDQLRTCERCGTFYITKSKMRQRFCNPACATSATADRSRTCTKCQSTYTARDVHYSVDPSLCPSCLEQITSAGHECPICEIPWWAPRNQHCCSDECQMFLESKQQLVTANGGNHAV
jgi:predicted nucleic acid-binding Zn ribbon protein